MVRASRSCGANAVKSKKRGMTPRGVIPLFFDFTAFAPQDLEARTIEFLVDGGFLSRGDYILLTMGTAQGEAGKTDRMKILPVE